MTIQDLYDIEGIVWSEIQAIREKRELETKSFVEGMLKGSDLLLKSVKHFMQKEEEKNQKEVTDNA